jgi:hypothetical protein
MCVCVWDVVPDRGGDLASPYDYVCVCVCCIVLNNFRRLAVFYAGLLYCGLSIF